MKDVLLLGSSSRATDIIEVAADMADRGMIPKPVGFDLFVAEDVPDLIQQVGRMRYRDAVIVDVPSFGYRQSHDAVEGIESLNPNTPAFILCADDSGFGYQQTNHTYGWSSSTEAHEIVRWILEVTK